MEDFEPKLFQPEANLAITLSNQANTTFELL